MKYADVRSKLKSGDLLAWSHRPWDTFYDVKIQAVRMITRSEYSHVGICWISAGRVWVIEAVQPRVRIYPLSKLGEFYYTTLDVAWTQDVEDAALEHIGVEYRQLDAIRAYFDMLESGKVSECAALALVVSMSGGVYLGDRATPDAVMREAQRLGNPTYLIEP
jgi:hypothetical protein